MSKYARKSSIEISVALNNHLHLFCWTDVFLRHARTFKIFQFLLSVLACLDSKLSYFFSFLFFFLFVVNFVIH